MQPNEPSKTLWIVYRNWRGEVSGRLIRPQGVHFGATEYHKEPQWLLTAFDTAKEDFRTFAIRDILSISAGPYIEPPNFDVALKAAAAGHPLARMLMDALTDWATETGRPMADKYRDLAARMMTEAGS